MESGTTDHHHQDFSFPVINDTTTTAYAIDSPPLWCSSPAAAYSISFREQEAEEQEDYSDCFTIAEEHPLQVIKSCSTTGEREGRIRLMEIGLDEKMDKLWEDFNNDELFGRNGSSRLMEGDVVSIGCIEALRFSKSPTTTTGGGGGGGCASFSVRRPTFVVFIKVMKKLFLLHNSHLRPVVKPPTCHPAGQTKTCILI